MLRALLTWVVITVGVFASGGMYEYTDNQKELDRMFEECSEQQNRVICMLDVMGISVISQEGDTKDAVVFLDRHYVEELGTYETYMVADYASQLFNLLIDKGMKPLDALKECSFGSSVYAVYYEKFHTPEISRKEEMYSQWGISVCDSQEPPFTLGVVE